MKTVGTNVVHRRHLLWLFYYYYLYYSDYSYYYIFCLRARVFFSNLPMSKCDLIRVCVCACVCVRMQCPVPRSPITFKTIYLFLWCNHDCFTKKLYVWFVCVCVCAFYAKVTPPTSHYLTHTDININIQNHICTYKNFIFSK